MLLWFLLAFLPCAEHALGAYPVSQFRPPSVPLITSDPYMSIWSSARNLHDDVPRYWDSTPKRMAGYIRIDAEAYNFLGPNSDGPSVGHMNQTVGRVWPTYSQYYFVDPKKRVEIFVNFFAPSLPAQWDISSRPVTYVTFNVYTIDGLQHSIQLYFDISAEVAVNTDNQQVTWDRFEVSNSETTASVLKIGTVSQDYFGNAGDAVGIDWGNAYLAVVEDESVSNVITGSSNAHTQFINYGTIPENDDTNKPRQVSNDLPVMAVAWDFLIGTSNITKFVTFAYNDEYSIDYFGKTFKSYWQRPAVDASIETLLLNSVTEFNSIRSDCSTFSQDHFDQLSAKGGDYYATLASLAYRQTMGATKLVWNDQLQMPWAFMKEISNGGFISTVDVIASASPLFLYNDPAFLELLILPILSYANNETGSTEYNYVVPWAPSHLGLYPVANVTPAEQKNMPMEQTANIFIMLAAITNKLQMTLRDLWYPRYWPLLQVWADYIVETLPDPESQASPDDFDESQEHNANLAIKGIVGLGAFAQLCQAVGKTSDYEYYSSKAVGFAAQWATLADGGDHSKRQFDLDNTWSQKYNLFFEKMLGLSIFSTNIVPEEMFYYLNGTLNPRGIPLDDRQNYTRLDSTALLAAMTTDVNYQAEIFQTMFIWANTTVPMTPLTDWYDTESGNQTGHTARPVVGALYGLMVV